MMAKRYPGRMRLIALASLVLSVTSCALTADGTSVPAAAEVSRCDPDRPRAGRLEVVVAPESTEAPLLALIDGAAASIDVVIYQLSSEAVIAALAAAPARGVRVRVIVDQAEARPDAVRRLRAAGVEVELSSAEFQHTHQKTVVADHARAFVFSGNFDGRAFVRGRNYGVVDTDREDIADLDEVFEADWNHRAPVLDCTRLVVSPLNTRARILGLLERAKTSLDVAAMYVTDREVSDAIVAAHRRGVAVRVLLNDPSFGIGDSARLVRRLQGLGLTVKRSGTRFLHAKLLVADGDAAFVGSANFSRPALDDNREAGVIVHREDGDVATIVATFEADWAASPVWELEATAGTDPSR